MWEGNEKEISRACMHNQENLLTRERGKGRNEEGYLASDLGRVAKAFLAWAPVLFNKTHSVWRDKDHVPTSDNLVGVSVECLALDLDKWLQCSGREIWTRNRFWNYQHINDNLTAGEHKITQVSVWG